MEPYLTDDEFWQYFEYLQLLNTVDCSVAQWSHYTAGVSHVDIYGITINKKEPYFKKQLHNKEFKLSRQSMDEFLFLLFAGAPILQARCEKLRQEQISFIAKAKNKRKW